MPGSVKLTDWAGEVLRRRLREVAVGVVACSGKRSLEGTVALIDRVARPTVDVSDAGSDCCGGFVERCRQP